MNGNIRYLNANIRILTMIGLYSLHENSSLIMKIVHAVWRIVNFIIFASTTLFIIMKIATTKHYDFRRNAHGMLHMMVYATSAYLYVYFYVRHKSLSNIQEFMNSRFLYRTDDSPEQLTMERYVKVVKRMLFAIDVFVFITGGSMLIAPFLSHTKERKLPIPAWYPFDWKSSPAYEWTYASQILTQLLLALSIGNTNALFPCVAYLTVGQFNILGANFRNVFYSALIEYGLHSDEVVTFSADFNGNQKRYINEKRVMQIIESPKFQTILIDLFHKHAKYYEALLVFVKDVDDFFSYYFVFKIAMYMMYIIVILYTIVFGKDKSFMLPSMIYFTSSMLTVFIFTFVGQIYTDESAAIRQRLYESPWYLGSKSFKQSFIIVQMATTRQLVLTAGKIMDMNLDTYKAMTLPTPSCPLRNRC
ncbi:Odorant receptor Or115 [Rhyzopertha dominica]|nr:Odorant receptor Or115 [Rhyzopertha dominica]